MSQKNVVRHNDIKITTLDKRYKGNDRFRMFAEPKLDSVKDKDIRDEIFCQMRTWCWENFGDSAEFDIVMSLNLKVKWCWDSSSNDGSFGRGTTISNRRIYLNISDDEMALFVLRWA
jgi:hypothetical protein